MEVFVILLRSLFMQEVLLIAGMHMNKQGGYEEYKRVLKFIKKDHFFLVLEPYN